MSFEITPEDVGRKAYSYSREIWTIERNPTSQHTFIARFPSGGSLVVDKNGCDQYGDDYEWVTVYNGHTNLLKECLSIYRKSVAARNAIDQV